MVTGTQQSQECALSRVFLYLFAITIRGYSTPTPYFWVRENRDGPAIHLSHPSCVCREQQLGICTVDGSLGLSAGEHIERFYADPAAHCVGYGRMIRQSTATSDVGAGEGVDATADISVTEPLSRPNVKGVIRGGLVTDIAVPEDGKISSPVIAAVAVALEPSPKQASVSRNLREYSLVMTSVGDPGLWEGSERSTETSTTSAACSDLMVSRTHAMLPPPPPSTLRRRGSFLRGNSTLLPQILQNDIYLWLLLKDACVSQNHSRLKSKLVSPAAVATPTPGSSDDGRAPEGGSGVLGGSSRG